jgi:hypothetical protein
MTPSWLAQADWQQKSDAPGLGFRWGRHGEDYACEWSGRLAVLADPTGTLKASWAWPKAPRELVEKVMRGEAAAFLRAIRGGFSLHASAVTRERRALILSGPSGVGKSSIASRLCESFGSTLLADDVAGFVPNEKTLRVEPGERAVWIEEGRGRKSPVQTQSAAEPADVALLVFLRFDDSLETLQTRALGASATVTRVLEGLFRFDPKPELWDREFEVLSRLIRGVPRLEVARPHNVSVHQTTEALARLLAGTQTTTSRTP